MRSINPHIRIVIADDHELLREGFLQLIRNHEGIEVVGEASHGKELLSLVQQHTPDVVITDIKMPYMDGIEATRQIRKQFPEIGIIALTMYEDDSLIVDMLEAGAKGYLVKSAGRQDIIAAIRSVYEDNTYYCRLTTDKLTRMIASSKFNPYRKPHSPQFTERELQVIKLICRQYSNKEMSAELELSIRTVEGYREKVQEKMDVKNTAGIVVYALKKGLVSYEEISV